MRQKCEILEEEIAIQKEKIESLRAEKLKRTMQLCQNADTKNKGKYTDDYFYKKYFTDQQTADNPETKVDDRPGTGPYSTEDILKEVKKVIYLNV